MKDRTAEFQAACDSIQSRFPGPNMPLLPNSNDMGASDAVNFSRSAAGIGRDIEQVSGKLERLATLAKSKSLFEDRPVEIQELTFVIKQDMAKINGQIAALQQRQSEQRNDSSASGKHAKNVVVSLQSKLASTSTAFQDILELRTKNMQEQQSRREQFNSSTVVRNTIAQENIYGTDLVGGANSNSDFTAIAIPNSTSFQQMQYAEPEQSNYLDARTQAIQGIESTIAELATIFQQLTRMVAEQGETVQRIDADIEEMQINVERGQQQLATYLRNISSNRWLMIKAFSIIIVFFLVFTLFIA